MKKKAAVIGALILVIALIALVAITTCLPMLKMADDPEEIRIFIEERGIWGVLFFIFVTAVQVIAAVIPGGPLEIAAGYCFGPVKGALIADIGMTLGSMAVFCFVRRFGMSFVEIFFSKEKIESLKFLKTNRNSKIIIFFLFLIPGAPKDLLAYGVGLTDISIYSWLFITAIGRFPSILLSAMGGDILEEQRYGVFVIVLLVIVVLTLAGSLLYRKISD
ncbi:MAG: TVP38/TMEM64 family protein [Lachnospiraceae bacterium]|nr:TVP38/TMEM64 family protein [Lachnospiraceae bacterium]